MRAQSKEKNGSGCTGARKNCKSRGRLRLKGSLLSWSHHGPFLQSQQNDFAKLNENLSFRMFLVSALQVPFLRLTPAPMGGTTARSVSRKVLTSKPPVSFLRGTTLHILSVVLILGVGTHMVVLMFHFAQTMNLGSLHIIAIKYDMNFMHGSILLP